MNPFFKKLESLTQDERKDILSTYPRSKLESIYWDLVEAEYKTGSRMEKHFPKTLADCAQILNALEVPR